MNIVTIYLAVGIVAAGVLGLCIGRLVAKTLRMRRARAARL